MSRAIALAERGFYTVRQNPRVGCVIVNNGEIVGEGWHQQAGEAHAEIMALHYAGSAAKGAVCYTTLEPCTHTGKTPPCTEALIKSGIKRVVIASLDPNPIVHHNGVNELRKAGIMVDTGILEQEACELNKGFFQRMKYHRPYVRVKMGLSLDGRTALANGKSQWITSEASRRDVQYWRARSCAVLTSSQTVLSDNPQMTVRDQTVIADIEATTDVTIVQPKRIVIDTFLKTSPEMKIFQANKSDVIVVTAKETPITDEWKKSGIKIVPLLDKRSTDKDDLQALMKWLADEQINELWVEAGSLFSGALVQTGLVDEWVLYVAPCFLGSDAKPLVVFPELSDLSEAVSLTYTECKAIGSDLRIIARANRDL